MRYLIQNLRCARFCVECFFLFSETPARRVRPDNRTRPIKNPVVFLLDMLLLGFSMMFMFVFFVTLSAVCADSIERGAFLNGKWVSYPPSLHDCATSVDELSALKDIHHHLGGATWRRSWDLGLCPCIHSWPGVACDNQGRVTALDLSANNVKGNITAAFQSLTHLSSLRLDGNEGLTGTIPPFLSRLTHLEELLLFNTDLEGTLPGPVANLKRLALVFVDAPDRERPTIPGTLSKHKQVYVDSPYMDTNDARVPPMWTGGLGGVDKAQAQKTFVSGTSKSGAFIPQVFNPEYQAGPFNLPPK